MVVKVSKPEINVREKISELDKPSGTAGEAMLRAETPQEQFNLISAGRRNLIINGAMAFSQRNGTSLITLNSAGSVLYEFDRWSRQVQQNGKITLQQVTDAPTGFGFSIKATTASAITASGSDYYMIRQPIEGFNSAHLAYGTSSARTTTLSFWVKSTLTGQWSGSIKNATGNRAYTFPYYINSPSTWEYKTVIIPGDTSGTWIGSTNGIGLAVMYDLGTARSDLHGTLNSWTATNSYASSTGVKLVQNAGATWQITGVQLEVGKVATPFEHRSYGEELALTQRYYQIIQCKDNNGNVALIRNRSTHNEYSGTVYSMSTMRTEPSVSHTGMDRLHKPGIVYDTVSSVSFNSHPDGTSARVNLVPGTNHTNALMGWFGANSGGSIKFDAEL
jgi:hypothetical protein